MITSEQAAIRRAEILERMALVSRVLAGKLLKFEIPLWKQEQENLTFELDSLSDI